MEIFSVFNKLAEYKSDLRIEVKIIGWYESLGTKKNANILSVLSAGI